MILQCVCDAFCTRFGRATCAQNTHANLTLSMVCVSEMPNLNIVLCPRLSLPLTTTSGDSRILFCSTDLTSQVQLSCAAGLLPVPEARSSLELLSTWVVEHVFTRPRIVQPALASAATARTDRAPWAGHGKTPRRDALDIFFCTLLVLPFRLGITVPRAHAPI